MSSQSVGLSSSSESTGITFGDLGDCARRTEEPRTEADAFGEASDGASEEAFGDASPGDELGDVDFLLPRVRKATLTISKFLSYRLSSLSGESNVAAAMGLSRSWFAREARKMLGSSLNFCSLSSLLRRRVGSVVSTSTESSEVAQLPVVVVLPAVLPALLPLSEALSQGTWADGSRKPPLPSPSRSD